MDIYVHTQANTYVQSCGPKPSGPCPYSVSHVYPFLISAARSQSLPLATRHCIIHILLQPSQGHPKPWLGKARLLSHLRLQLQPCPRSQHSFSSAPTPDSLFPPLAPDLHLAKVLPNPPAPALHLPTLPNHTPSQRHSTTDVHSAHLSSSHTFS